MFDLRALRVTALLPCAVCGGRGQVEALITTSIAMDDAEKEWRQATYESVIADPRLKALARDIAENSRHEGDPELGAGDMEAARRYLRKCMYNMGAVELQQVSNMELAALLARGALGAARYRARSAVPSGTATRRRPKSGR